MTDYTGVSMDVILAHLHDWRDATAGAIEALRGLNREIDQHRDKLNCPDEIRGYVELFLDLLGRYRGDFDRLLLEMPRLVTAAHVEIVQQIHDSAAHEEERCLRFKRDHISRSMKVEGLRWLVDDIYKQSKGMMIDYHDLSNLVRRLRTFVGTMPKLERELEQKFGILFSAAQEQRDFSLWVEEGATVTDYSIGVVFVDVDDFKKINSKFTEFIVDRDILPPLQRLVRDASLHKGSAYRHGGEELVIILPNFSLVETETFAEKLRARIQVHAFSVNEKETAHLTISAGVAAYPVNGNSLSEVIQAANKAEHEAKAAGEESYSHGSRITCRST
jgi:diguanylate cyclase (GGDEF)-like protein